MAVEQRSARAVSEHSEPARLLARARDEGVFSGAAWSVGTAAGPTDRGVLGTRAWGAEAVDAATLWDLASVTKPVVGLAVMAAVERGQLCLGDPVVEYLPTLTGVGKTDVTVWHLLTHTSGFPGGLPLFRTHERREQMLDAVYAYPLRCPPGQRVEYSSFGFVLLGLVAEAATGVSLDALITETVSAPLGLTDTMYCPPPDYRHRAAATEECPWRGHVVRGLVHDENAEVLGGVTGHAGLFATLHDVERLAVALVRDGTGEHGRLLGPRTLAVMTRPATDGLNLRRSLAWQGKDLLGSPAGDLMSSSAYGHTGFTGTSLWVDPELGCYVVLLTNRVHPSRESEAITRLRPRFHNVAVSSLSDEQGRPGG